jgi:hypothetical protein
MHLEDAKVMREAAIQMMQQVAQPYSSIPFRSADPFMAASAVSLPSVGIGIRATQTQNDFKLAIHIPSEAYRAIVRPIVELARGEVHVQMTGTVNVYGSEERNDFYRQRQRPLLIGLSVSPSASLDAGTLGCFVRRPTQSELFILSCNHVIAERNDGTVGAPICQPAIADGGHSSADQIARLQSFVHLKPGDHGTTSVDAAIASVEDAEVADVAQLGNRLMLCGVSTLEELTETLPRLVLKTGKQTGITQGTLQDFGIRRLIPYGINLTCDFTNLIAIEGIGNQPFSQPGDSGSVIYDADGYAIALLIGGTKSGGENNCGITYASPIDAVLHELDLELALS